MTERLQKAISFAADHPAAAAHFPGRPIVPGVWLLEEVLRCLEESGYRLGALRSARFAASAQPAEALLIQIALSDGEARFLVQRGDEVLLRGSIAVELS